MGSGVGEDWGGPCSPAQARGEPPRRVAASRRIPDVPQPPGRPSQTPDRTGPDSSAGSRGQGGGRAASTRDPQGPITPPRPGKGTHRVDASMEPPTPPQDGASSVRGARAAEQLPSASAPQHGTAGPSSGRPASAPPDLRPPRPPPPRSSCTTPRPAWSPRPRSCHLLRARVPQSLPRIRAAPAAPPPVRLLPGGSACSPRACALPAAGAAPARPAGPGVGGGVAGPGRSGPGACAPGPPALPAARAP